MNTINIIDNFDQNILMENILLANQKKLLDFVLGIFEKDFGEKKLDELTIEYVENYFNKMKLINWDLFLRLINLKLEIDNFPNSIRYIIYKCSSQSSIKIIEFLLGLPKGLVHWENIDIHYILRIKKFYSSNFVIDEIFNSNIVDKDFWYSEYKDEKTNTIYSSISWLFIFGNDEQILKIIQSTPTLFDMSKIIKSNGIDTYIIYRMVSQKYIKSLEYVFENYKEINYEIIDKKIIIYRACEKNNIDIIKLLVKYKFDFNDNVIYNNCNGYNNDNNSLLKINSEEIMLYLIYKNNLTLNNDIFYHSIRKNWIRIITYYFESNQIEWDTLSYAWVLPRLIFNKHFEFATIVFKQSIHTCHSNIYLGLELYYMDPYGLQLYDFDQKSDQKSNQINNENLIISTKSDIEKIEKID